MIFNFLFRQAFSDLFKCCICAFDNFFVTFGSVRKFGNCCAESLPHFARVFAVTGKKCDAVCFIKIEFFFEMPRNILSAERRAFDDIKRAENLFRSNRARANL